MSELTASSIKKIDLLQLADVTSIAVASTGTGRTFSIPLPQDASFAVHVTFTSGGAVDVQIDFEQGNVRPATEAATSTDYVIPDGASAVANGITDEVQHIIAFSPVVSRFGRFLFTGQGSNAASTTVTKLEIYYTVNY